MTARVTSMPGPTLDELAVLEHLVAAWNAFIALPHEHSDDNQEFRHGIHALQTQVMARPTRRFIKGDLR